MERKPRGSSERRGCRNLASRSEKTHFCDLGSKIHACVLGTETKVENTINHFIAVRRCGFDTEYISKSAVITI